jgi:hypothetical protein
MTDETKDPLLDIDSTAPIDATVADTNGAAAEETAEILSTRTGMKPEAAKDKSKAVNFAEAVSKAVESAAKIIIANGDALSDVLTKEQKGMFASFLSDLRIISKQGDEAFEDANERFLDRLANLEASYLHAIETHTAQADTETGDKRDQTLKHIESLRTMLDSVKGLSKGLGPQHNDKGLWGQIKKGYRDFMEPIKGSDFKQGTWLREAFSDGSERDEKVGNKVTGRRAGAALEKADSTLGLEFDKSKGRYNKPGDEPEEEFVKFRGETGDPRSGFTSNQVAKMTKNARSKLEKLVNHVHGIKGIDPNDAPIVVRKVFEPEKNQQLTSKQLESLADQLVEDRRKVQSKNYRNPDGTPNPPKDRDSLKPVAKPDAPAEAKVVSDRAQKSAATKERHKAFMKENATLTKDLSEEEQVDRRKKYERPKRSGKPLTDEQFDAWIDNHEGQAAETKWNEVRDAEAKESRRLSKPQNDARLLAEAEEKKKPKGGLAGPSMVDTPSAALSPETSTAATATPVKDDKATFTSGRELGDLGTTDTSDNGGIQKEDDKLSVAVIEILDILKDGKEMMASGAVAGGAEGVGLGSIASGATTAAEGAAVAGGTAAATGGTAAAVGTGLAATALAATAVIGSGAAAGYMMNKEGNAALAAQDSQEDSESSEYYNKLATDSYLGKKKLSPGVMATLERLKKEGKITQDPRPKIVSSVATPKAPAMKEATELAAPAPTQPAEPPQVTVNVPPTQQNASKDVSVPGGVRPTDNVFTTWQRDRWSRV